MGPASGTRRARALGAPALLVAMLRVGPSPHSHANDGGVRRGQLGLGAGQGPQYRAPHPTAPGCSQSSVHFSGSSHRVSRRYGALAAAVQGTSIVPSPSFVLKTFLLFKAESKLRDLRLQLEVYYDGLLNQFVPL